MSVNLKYDTDPEALAWARAGVQGLVDKMRRFERQAAEQGTTDPAQWRKIANIVESHLIGGKGCVIATFDERRAKLAPIIAEAIERRAQ
jgi:hypothetical protein